MRCCWGARVLTEDGMAKVLIIPDTLEAIVAVRESVAREAVRYGAMAASALSIESTTSAVGTRTPTASSTSAFMRTRSTGSSAGRRCQRLCWRCPRLDPRRLRSF